MLFEPPAAIELWDTPPVATAALVLAGVVYWRGWRRIRRTRPSLFPDWRLGCFLAGLFALLLALASPLDTLDDKLLTMHMMQHLVFMSVAPPLLLLGAPVVPMLRGLPRPVIRRVIGPIFRWRIVHALQKLFSSLAFAWLAMNLFYLGWHVPAAYELALRSENWHDVEHACFFFTSLLFWWPIIQPWPSRFRGSRWVLLPYLLGADLVNTALSAFLCFSARLLYPSYANGPQVFGMSPMNDQVAAGALMWVLGSMIFLAPIMLITLQMLSPRRQSPATGSPLKALL
ncbi:cytochrome c oxidase assembly protein [Acidipila rosea]|uniref:Cytochrome c oxidase assembly factor CtaG n=1 Tax=Acidipila rosea TaxID=768535 RepID=A0A4R1L7P3_9BACT|nr:cytochrome c oxidase assembly protein [Acidipila rosea]TCK74238.1 cytochrome c oxidase assembly factor CtaG [Acidipila rosea]